MEAPARRYRENWADENYVQDWLDRQPARAEERERHFRLIRSVVPRRPDESFSYINIGAGDGWLDGFMLARFSNARATLLDSSPLMGKKSLERLAQYPGRVTTVTADLSTPDWRNQLNSSFDVAVSSIAIHNLRDPRRIRELYAEVFSILNDGGFFANFDYVRPTSPVLRPLAVLAGSDPEAGYTQRITGGQNSPGTIGEQLIWMREAGFTAVDCYWKEFHASLFGGFKGTVQIPEPA